MFDPEAIHRAVLNIATNAIDACEDCPRREVSVATRLSDDGKRAVIEVQDSGVGIAAKDIENIFTVFVSGKGGRGTGLGLPVSQKIFQEHGGLIRVESEPGTGSKFLLELPMHPVVEGNKPLLMDDDGSDSGIRDQAVVPVVD